MWLVVLNVLRRFTRMDLFWWMSCTCIHFNVNKKNLNVSVFVYQLLIPFLGWKILLLTMSYNFWHLQKWKQMKNDNTGDSFCAKLWQCLAFLLQCPKFLRLKSQFIVFANPPGFMSMEFSLPSDWKIYEQDIRETLIPTAIKV